MITTEKDRTRYNEYIKPYQDTINILFEQKNKARADIDNNTQDPELKRYELVDMMLNITSYFLVINGVSQSVLDQKNEDALNDARKSLTKSIKYLEDTVSTFLDVSFSDYEKKLETIDSITPEQRYLLLQKMGLAIQLLKNAYGDTSKWKWSFVELEGRFAIVAKNLLNLRDVMKNSNMQSPHYRATNFHITLVKNLLMQAADRYRDKYELSTSNPDDFKTGINYLSALKRINILTGKQSDAENVQKKLDVWKNKLAADINKQKQLSGKN